MRLLALRHGQASFHASDYDQLSALGVQQCQAAGRWLAQQNERFDRLVIGGLRRHRQSVDALIEGYGGSGLPAIEVDRAFDEFDHRQVVGAFCRAHPEHPSVQAADTAATEPARLFSLLRQALLSWARGELDADTEAWASFCRRTRAAGAALAAGGGSVLLLSSAGVIAQLAADALAAPDDRAVELNLRLRNSAMVELLAHDGELRLAGWNTLPHLADRPALWSYL